MIEEPEVMAQELINFVNTYRSSKVDRLVYALTQTHRSLQQRVMAFVLRFIYAMADQQSYDKRNEQAVLTARRIKDLLGPDGDHLRLV